MTNTSTKKQVGEKGFIRLSLPDHRPSSEELKQGWNREARADVAATDAFTPGLQK